MLQVGMCGFGFEASSLFKLRGFDLRFQVQVPEPQFPSQRFQVEVSRGTFPDQIYQMNLPV